MWIYFLFHLHIFLAISILLPCPNYYSSWGTLISSLMNLELKFKHHPYEYMMTMWRKKLNTYAIHKEQNKYTWKLLVEKIDCIDCSEHMFFKHITSKVQKPRSEAFNKGLYKTWFYSYGLMPWKWNYFLEVASLFLFDELCFIAATHTHYLQLNTSTGHHFCLFMLYTLRKNISSCSETNAQ
jgi:hypothetical protein